jgi:curved DNA-binding protein CbpA
VSNPVVYVATKRLACGRVREADDSIYDRKISGILTYEVLRRDPYTLSLYTMLTVVDPYRVLQVLPDAEPEVIQAAYRALARKHHPDMGGSQLEMATLNAAWETLRDERERARYDRQRKTAPAPPAAQPEMTRAEPSGAGQWPSASAPSPRPASARARSGTVLDYGRYAGFSLGELAIQDRNYLEWLARTPMGRRLQQEIETLLTPSRPTAAPRPPRPKSRLLRRR